MMSQGLPWGFSHNFKKPTKVRSSEMGKKKHKLPGDWNWKFLWRFLIATPKIEEWKKHQKGDDVWGLLEGSQLILKRLDI